MTQHSRRQFLKHTSLMTLSGLMPLTAMANLSLQGQPSTPRKRISAVDAGSDAILLKNGWVVDGTGAPAYLGDVLMSGGKIKQASHDHIEFSGRSLDCSGKVVAPGFIDVHSHLDWVLPARHRPDLLAPFTQQGITTFITGNCGFGVAGFKKDSQYRELLERKSHGLYPMTWHSMEEYLNELRAMGITNNTATLAGLGTSRTSITGYNAGPLSQTHMDELLGLVGDAMDQGAYGVSLGLGYEPGIFSTQQELSQVAKLVRQKDKILTVHMKAYSALSGTYPLNPFADAHNLQAIEDMIHIARETGVRLQLSHLIFVGSLTWKNFDQAIALIDNARAEGLDIMFDTYAHHAGNSIVNVFMPEWFLAKGPAAFESSLDLLRLRAEITFMDTVLGFGYKDIQLSNGYVDQFKAFEGMFFPQIAQQRGMSNFENLVDISRQTQGKARVINHSYSTLQQVHKMMKHPACLFQTDTQIAHSGIQNPGSYGTYPRFLQYVREDQPLSLEQFIHKATAMAADRFGLKDRGRLQVGKAADVVVFDFNKVRDNTTKTDTSAPPSGIEQVFINGQLAVNKGKLNTAIYPGQVL